MKSSIRNPIKIEKEKYIFKQDVTLYKNRDLFFPKALVLPEMDCFYKPFFKKENTNSVCIHLTYVFKNKIRTTKISTDLMYKFWNQNPKLYPFN